MKRYIVIDTKVGMILSDYTMKYVEELKKSKACLNDAQMEALFKYFFTEGVLLDYDDCKNKDAAMNGLEKAWDKLKDTL